MSPSATVKLPKDTQVTLTEETKVPLGLILSIGIPTISMLLALGALFSKVSSTIETDKEQTQILRDISERVSRMEGALSVNQAGDN